MLERLPAPRERPWRSAVLTRELAAPCDMDAPAPPASRFDMQAGTMLGPYRVVRLLGKGGMGVVYEATHATLGRRVAVKVLRPELSADADRATRFVQEAQVVNLVDHPGLVQMVDLGQTAEGTPYIVMELLRGMTLGARLKEQGGKMPWPDDTIWPSLM